MGKFVGFGLWVFGGSTPGVSFPPFFQLSPVVPGRVIRGFKLLKSPLFSFESRSTEVGFFPDSSSSWTPSYRPLSFSHVGKRDLGWSYLETQNPQRHSPALLGLIFPFSVQKVQPIQIILYLYNTRATEILILIWSSRNYKLRCFPNFQSEGEILKLNLWNRSFWELEKKSGFPFIEL
jgi:hypothetical protein